MGTPLASPRRRAVALAIDGVVIGIITAVTQSFALILGVVAAGFFIRAGFKRTKVRNSVFGRAMRFSVGCLGIFIAMITATIWIAVTNGDSEPAVTVTATGEVADFAENLALRGMLAAFEEVESVSEAEVLVEQVIVAARALSVPDTELRRVLVAAIPPDAPLAPQLAATVDRFLPPEIAEEDRDRIAELREEIDAYSTEEALAEYGRLLTADPADPDLALRSGLLEERLAGVVAGDSIRRLQAQAEVLADEVGDLEEGIEELQEELAEATSGGIFARLIDFADTVGFGFSWGILYTTVLLSWWNGLTVGKKMMGVRVVRLDGEPITWWVAFERAGGYAAGLATGLLGFAQVWWDSNRQMIHDRIVGTAVVVDGAERVTDWESAL